MNLNTSIDAWIQETKDAMNTIQLQLDHAEEVKRRLNTMYLPQGLPSTFTTDIDLAALQVDKAIRQLNEVKRKLEARIWQLQKEKTQAHESEGPRKLPTVRYNGKDYTWDERLNEFRFIVYGRAPEYVRGGPLFGDLMTALNEQLPKSQQTRSFSSLGAARKNLKGR